MLACARAGWRQTQNKLKGSDARKLRAKIVKVYPSLTEEQLDEVLPDKGLTLWKLSNRTLLYAVGEDLPFIGAQPPGNSPTTRHHSRRLTGRCYFQMPKAAATCTRLFSRCGAARLCTQSLF